MEWAGVKRTVWTDQVSVEASALNAKDHGFIVLVNHSAEVKHVLLDSTLPITSLENAGSKITRAGSGWALDVPAYDAEVLQWR